MKIQAIIPFTMRDNSTGELTSIADGQVVEVTDAVGNQFISDGLAKEFTLITPSGSETITANGTYDVTAKASVTVNVGVVTISYDANGGTGSVAAVTAAKGSSVVLSDGTGLTAPEGKTFAGWGSTADKTEPDVTSPMTASDNVTLYAVYVSQE